MTRTGEQDLLRKPYPASAEPSARLRTRTHPFLGLQKALGNQAVSHVIQAKLKIGQPGDVYEQEADHAAERVMRTREPHLRTVGGGNGCSKGGENGASYKQIQPKALQDRKAAETHVPPVVREVLSSSGQPLDPTARSVMESHFGHDFGSVRVHADARAADSARSLGARAYTVGSEVVFGASQYEPGTAEGRRLLAHELTHVIQQHSAVPSSNLFLQLQDAGERWTAPTAGVVQAWMYNQIDNWHTGATQALEHFKNAVLGQSSVGFWLQLAGNVLWALGGIFPPAGAVATGLAGVALATIGGRVQERQQQAAYQRVQDIYNDLLEGLNSTRSRMDRMVIAQANRVMATGRFQAAVGRRDTEAWQRVVRSEINLPDAENVNAVSHNVEQNLYIRYLRNRGAWVSHDIFEVPSPHHPGTTSEFRHFYPHRIPEKVQRRLERIGVDWRRMYDLPIPHRHRYMSRLEGTVGSIEYWNYREVTDFPPSWTEAEKQEFLSQVPSYLRSRQTGVTY